jgi:hypothetical protein
MLIIVKLNADVEQNVAMFVVTCFRGWQRGDANPRVTVRKVSFGEWRVWALGFGRGRWLEV